MSKMTKVIAGLGVVAALGVAALPMASYAANQGAVDITATIADNLSLELTNTTVNETLVNNAAVLTSGTTTTAKVTTNNLNGYTLTAPRVELAGTNNSSEAIEYGVATQGDSAWNITANGAAVASAASLAIASSDEAVDGVTTGVTTIGYQFSASATQAQDTYTGELVITANNVQ